MEDVFSLFINEDDYPDLDSNGAISRLSKAISYPTVSDCTDPKPFDDLHTLMTSGYPNVMSYGTFELIGRSVLITLPGNNTELLPALFMAHQDVVPVVSGTESDWTYPAFSGAVEEGFVWGRGTLDIKNMVFAELEAAEYLLGKGSRPERTIYLAFGEDEETFNRGAKSISDTLLARGVRLEFVLDEGGGNIEDGALFGAPGVNIAAIDLMEKGYADLDLCVQSKGGHSSKPWGGTSLARLAKAITSITSNPFPPKLSGVMAACFAALGPYITEEPLKSLIKDIDGNRDAIAKYCLNDRNLFNLVVTTIAPTMISGSSQAPNVMPQDMKATVNFRLADGDTPASVMEHCAKCIGDESVTLSFSQADPASAMAKHDGYGYSMVKEALQHYYGDVVFYPTISPGATDAHHYEQICDTCLRRSPFFVPSDDSSGVHGTNERIVIRSYIQGIRMLIRLMKATCC